MERHHTTGLLGGGRPTSTPTYVLEYLVSELADGITPSPQFAVDGAIPSDGPSDPEQIYQFSVERLGLIDLSLSGILPAEMADNPSALGQRYITWAWARDFVLGSVSPLHVANRIGPEGVVDVETLEVLPLASNQMYSQKGYVFPHGTVLRVADMAPAVPGVPFLIRIGIIVPQSIRDDALMRDALCCTRDIPTTTNTEAECTDPAFLVPGVTPDSFVLGVNQIQINVMPVIPGITSVAVNGPGAPVVALAVEYIFPDTILFTANFDQLGSHSITVNNGVGCETILPNAFTVGTA